MLAYGSPRQSGDLFREIAKANPQDVEAWSGLGLAEMSLEDYAKARDAFSGALRINPEDATSRKQLAVSERVLALDPDARGIRASERYHRSQALLEGALETRQQCAAGGPDRQLAENARNALAARPGSGQLGDATEQNLTLAADLWKHRQQACPRYAAQDEALERVLARLSRS